MCTYLPIRCTECVHNCTSIAKEVCDKISDISYNKLRHFYQQSTHHLPEGRPPDTAG